MLKEISIAAIIVSLFSQVASAQVVARIGKNEITLKDFKEKYEDVKRQTINPPTPEIFLEDLVRFEMGVQEAEKHKLENDPVVKERIRQEIYKAFVEKEIGKQVSGIKVTEAEMRKYYKSNPEIRTSHILIEHKADASPEQVEMARKRANEIYKEVKSSKRPFEELVKLYSDDTYSKNTGGDIGYQNRMTVVPAYYEAILKLKTGQITGPVRSQYGFHIIKVTGRRDFNEANRNHVRDAVYDQKRKAIFDKYFKTLSSRYPVTKNEKLIKSLK